MELLDASRPLAVGFERIRYARLGKTHALAFRAVGGDGGGGAS